MKTQKRKSFLIGRKGKEPWHILGFFLRINEYFLLFSHREVTKQLIAPGSATSISEVFERCDQSKVVSRYSKLLGKLVE